MLSCRPLRPNSEEYLGVAYIKAPKYGSAISKLSTKTMSQQSKVTINPVDVLNDCNVNQYVDSVLHV